MLLWKEKKPNSAFPASCFTLGKSLLSGHYALNLRLHIRPVTAPSGKICEGCKYTPESNFWVPSGLDENSTATAAGRDHTQIT
jgi:hypothetical protein